MKDDFKPFEEHGKRSEKGTPRNKFQHNDRRQADNKHSDYNKNNFDSYKESSGKMEQIFEGVYKSGRRLYTENFAPGTKVYGERILKLDKEYREWEPTRSKLAAAILNRIKNMPIKKGSKVLYLGASTGTTVSHVSDIVGEKGITYCVEFSERVFREFLRVASARENIVPILSDARKISNFDWIEECQTVFCDLAQSDQTEIAIRNCDEFLSDGGLLLLSIKSQSIDISKRPDQVYKEEADKLAKSGFKILEIINLEPHEQKHALIVARK
jgi:fibrillarin-like pre-rRNA processing protein